MVFLSWVNQWVYDVTHVAVIGPETGMPNPEIRCRILVAMLQKLIQSHLTKAHLGISTLISAENICSNEIRRAWEAGFLERDWHLKDQTYWSNYEPKMTNLMIVWMRFVRSRQSKQLVRKIPSCCNVTAVLGYRSLPSSCVPLRWLSSSHKK